MLEDGLVDAGNMALEKVSVAVDLPSRDVNLDKLEADIGKALKKLVDLKPDEYYNLAYEKLPVTAKTLLVTAELGTEIATGEFTSYNQLKANTKENFKNLAKGGEYCITDMIAGAIKLPNMGTQLISSKHTKHMNQLQDIADCRGSFEDYADIKLEKIENAINSIESAAVTAGADFINSSKEEKYQTLGYAGTTIAMFADAAFSLAEGIKAARAAAKATKAAEALAEGGEVIAETEGVVLGGAETAAETGEVLVEAGENACYSNSLYDYKGVQQASEYLKEQGGPRLFRKQILESFDVRTIKIEYAGENTFGLRFYGGNANAEGRYFFETFSPLSNRENLALPYEWNRMTGIQQFKIKNGTVMITGQAASQYSYGTQYVGGAKQWYINSLEDLTKCQ